MPKSLSCTTEWTWKGARWWKFDFHTHTPASEDYGKGPQQAQLKQRTPREWLLDHMRAGIECVAITDHNSGAWVDKLKAALAELESEKPDGFHPLWLFPGVEISVNGGIHLLAILDPSKTTSDVDTLLGAVGFTGIKGKSDDVTARSFTEVVREIERAGGIAIPAHVDGDNGLFKLTGTTLNQALECGSVVAMEVVDPSSQMPGLYKEKKLRWTEVLGSDAHHPQGKAGQRFPGSHFTWIKMGPPSLEGLRLALLDGPLSGRRFDQVPEDPNRHADLVIESIEVSNARYMGRSQTFKVELNPWLNAIIGGRGTGKSTLVEFVRMALRRESELPKALATDFEKYLKVYQSRDDDGLLTGDSRFTVTYRKDRTRFRIQWSQRGNVEPIEVQDGNGVWKPDQGDVAQRFPVRIYSQKQIFELAKAPLALLRIVDDAREVDRRSWDERWKEEEARFLSLRAKAREIEAGLADEPRLRGELEDIGRRLAIFEEAGHADVLKEYQKRLRQQRGVQAWEQTWSGSGDRLRSLAGDLLPDSLDASLFEADRDEDQDILQKGATPLTRLEAVRVQLEDLARETDEALTQWNRARDESAWRLAVNRAIEEYEKLRQRLKAEEAGDPSAYGELVQRRQALEGRLKELESRRTQLENVRRDADESLARLRELRRDLTQRRSSFLDNILTDNPYVRIEVIPYGTCETVEPEFRRLLQREAGGFEKDIDALLDGLYTNGADAQAIEQRLAQIKAKLRDIAKGTYNGDLGDRRFAGHVGKLPPEVFDRLDLWLPEDSLQVQYSTTEDGSGFRSIQEGSPGQKTAALLAFLFSYGEEPIILDQPEDDLDNHLIYDLIVGHLRRIKQKRQVIVVTHNANIVLNGDAELVVALVPRSGETHQECAGCLQERKVRDTICAVMEGGREAFEKRYQRITLERWHHV
jgi:energy-coupling factor transporter ATP-binding protein EcfA2/histidinol phosphatase-like PHP family hydrolase